MTDRSDINGGLDPEEIGTAERLQRARPVPAAGFRGQLWRHLSLRDPGYGPRPVHLRAVAFAYLAAGSALLLIGGLQATGAL